MAVSKYATRIGHAPTTCTTGYPSRRRGKKKLAASATPKRTQGMRTLVVARSWGSSYDKALALRRLASRDGPQTRLSPHEHGN